MITCIRKVYTTVITSVTTLQGSLLCRHLEGCTQLPKDGYIYRGRGNTKGNDIIEVNNGRQVF